MRTRFAHQENPNLGDATQKSSAIFFLFFSRSRKQFLILHLTGLREVGVRVQKLEDKLEENAENDKLCRIFQKYF